MELKEQIYDVVQESFDATEVYSKEIEPLVVALNDKCEEHGVQIFIGACSLAKVDETGVGFNIHGSANLDAERTPLQLFAMHLIHMQDFDQAIEILQGLKKLTHTRHDM